MENKLKEHHKGKLKIIIAFSVLFLVVTLLIVMIFYAGKKTYVVQYDLNGGTLISGSLEQHITQGQNAIPPTVVKDGAYLYGWSESSDHITKDMVITAIWNYETTKGIRYSVGGAQNYAEIAGVYQYISGDVYLGSYYGDKKILGICGGAFANCEGITGVYLLDGLLYIGNDAFLNCKGLTEIEVPKTVTHLGSGVFRGCESLETVVLNEGLLEIGAGAFEGCTSLREIVIPSTVKQIDAGAFKGCESLEKIVISGEIEEIAPETFKDCVSLVEVVTPESILKIGDGAFTNCEALTNVTLNNGLLDIGNGVFEGCTALEEIEIPVTVKVIGADIFKDCEDITVTVNVLTEGEMPRGWTEGWQGDAEIIWVEHPDAETDETESSETDETESIVTEPYETTAAETTDAATTDTDTKAEYDVTDVTE